MSELKKKKSEQESEQDPKIEKPEDDLLDEDLDDVAGGFSEMQ